MTHTQRMRRLARALVRPFVSAASRACAQVGMASEATPVISSGAVEHPGWDYFRNVLGSAAYHVAPMVCRVVEVLCTSGVNVSFLYSRLTSLSWRFVSCAAATAPRVRIRRCCTRGAW